MKTKLLIALSLMVNGFVFEPVFGRSDGEMMSSERRAEIRKKHEEEQARIRAELAAEERSALLKDHRKKMDKLMKAAELDQANLKKEIDQEFVELRKEWGEKIESVSREVLVQDLLDVAKDDIINFIKETFSERGLVKKISSHTGKVIEDTMVKSFTPKPLPKFNDPKNTDDLALERSKQDYETVLGIAVSNNTRRYLYTESLRYRFEKIHNVVLLSRKFLKSESFRADRNEIKHALNQELKQFLNQFESRELPS